ncbi:MAG: DUF433 domain-containing protein [Caldilineaceae bacterium]|nr:DUF433 domain-containing protein [Caldilineaceae bacterium]
MQTTLTIDLIASDPTIRNGRPCIAGTGLRVTDLVAAHLFHQRTPDEIAANYELSLAQVYAALAYYYEHKLELDRDIRSQIDKARSLKEQALGRSPALLS